jgi:hypothetical protein
MQRRLLRLASSLKSPPRRVPSPTRAPLFGKPTPGLFDAPLRDCQSSHPLPCHLPGTGRGARQAAEVYQVDVFCVQNTHIVLVSLRMRRLTFLVACCGLEEEGGEEHGLEMHVHLGDATGPVEPSLCR